MALLLVLAMGCPALTINLGGHDNRRDRDYHRYHNDRRENRRHDNSRTWGRLMRQDRQPQPPPPPKPHKR